MTEVLTQDEINELLAAINASAEDDSESSGSDDRPKEIPREKLRAIHAIHENFARNACKSLSAQLGSVVKMGVASIDMLFMDEFFRIIPVPNVMGIINMEPLKGSIVMEIDPAIAFAIIDRIHGGSGEAKKQHELTDAEKIIMQGVFVSLLNNLREAWSETISLQPRFEKIETDPKFVQAAPLKESVVLVTLEAKIGNAEGMINCCIPYPVIQPIMEKLL